MTVHSSGSTGEPFEFYVSSEAYSINMAAKLRTWYDAGYRLGDSFVKLSSSPRESWLKRLQDRATNGIVIPFHSLDDKSLADILALIDRQRPKIIRTHPNAIYYLARYREAHPGCYQHQPQHIMTTSANLPDAFRVTVEHTFGCDVIDAYSCEGTPNTAETPAHDGYHVSLEYGIIEVLDDKGHPVQNGMGRVVSTDLWNMAMPFIRYDTQDLVRVDNGTIVRIAGRECELLSSANGKRFTGQVIDDYFNYGTDHSVDAFQVVRRHDGSILMRLMVNSNYTKAQSAAIADYWHRELDMPVVVEIVDHIPLMHNNKYLTIVDE
ncbi:MAG: phenylacetate--CoA ligase family protein [Bacteroidales bacterium]|nr:phenylacetate--CoA ligase family protein [Bacteroidales bacterium]